MKTFLFLALTLSACGSVPDRDVLDTTDAGMCPSLVPGVAQCKNVHLADGTPCYFCAGAHNCFLPDKGAEIYCVATSCADAVECE